jgi:hypothetical protein
MAQQSNMMQGLPFIWFRNLIYRHVVTLLRRGISTSQGPLHTDCNTNTDTETTQTHIRAPSVIRTSDPSVQAEEDVACLRPWDIGHP